MSLQINELKKIFNTAIEVIKKTDNILLKEWKKKKKIKFTVKEDFSPVTAKDYEIEKIFRREVMEKFPDHKILGEEFNIGGDKEGKYQWIIDPIDGTKQFIRGIDKFSTQVAVSYNNKIVIGISSAPLLNERMFAIKGKGAYLNNNKIRVSEIKLLKDAFLSYGNMKYFNDKSKLPQLIKLFNKSWTNRGYGDFWGYHLLANGRVDGMLEASTKIWDIGALSLIVKEAGGKVSDFDGRPISLESNSIVATNNLIHNEILSFF